MSSHHDDHGHSSEPKKVQFRTPQILGLVTILLILLAVSTCDNKKEHECCENEKVSCETKIESHDKNDHKESTQHAVVTDSLVNTIDTTKVLSTTMDTLAKQATVLETPKH